MKRKEKKNGDARWSVRVSTWTLGRYLADHAQQCPPVSRAINSYLLTTFSFLFLFAFFSFFSFPYLFKLDFLSFLIPSPFFSFLSSMNPFYCFFFFFFFFDSFFPLPFSSTRRREFSKRSPLFALSFPIFSLDRRLLIPSIFHAPSPHPSTPVPQVIQVFPSSRLGHTPVRVKVSSIPTKKLCTV